MYMYVCTLQGVTILCVQMVDTYEEQLNNWLTFVSISKVKAFVEIIPSLSVRAGTQTLLAVRWISFRKLTQHSHFHTIYCNFFNKYGCAFRTYTEFFLHLRLCIAYVCRLLSTVCQFLECVECIMYMYELSVSSSILWPYRPTDCRIGWHEAQHTGSRVLLQGPAHWHIWKPPHKTEETPQGRQISP